VASFQMYGRSWQVPAGMTKAEAMATVAAGRAQQPGAYLDPTADDQDQPGGASSYVGTSGAVPKQEEIAFTSDMPWVQPVAGQVTSGVMQPGAGLEGNVMPEYDAAGNYTSAGLATAGLALVPAVGAAAGVGARAFGALGSYLLGRGRAAAPFVGAGIAAETLLPGENIPFTPSGSDILETVGDWGQAVLDLAPGGMVPGERSTRKAFLAHLSNISGVEITAMTQMESGAWMGSYRTSPGAKRKRGIYIGPGGSPIKTWANRGMAVISRDPRGSALAKGARALDKATNRYIKADKVADKIGKRVRKKAKK